MFYFPVHFTPVLSSRDQAPCEFPLPALSPSAPRQGKIFPQGHFAAPLLSHYAHSCKAHHADINILSWMSSSTIWDWPTAAQFQFKRCERGGMHSAACTARSCMPVTWHTFDLGLCEVNLQLQYDRLASHTPAMWEYRVPSSFICPLHFVSSLKPFTTRLTQIKRHVHIFSLAPTGV